MCSMKTSAFLAEDNEKIDKLIEEHPRSLSIMEIANFLGMDVTSVRSAIENNIFGMSWRKTGSARKAYNVPTAQFVRWYLNMNVN